MSIDLSRPDGYAYKYPDGFTRFTNGERVNGSAPIRAIGYYFEREPEPQLYAPLRYPPLDTQCTAGPGMRCQCASCRAMRKQLWAVQPEESNG